MKIHIPTPLRQFAAKQATVTVSAGTVGEALDELTSTHPELKKHLYSEEGKLRAFVNVYLNDEDIRYLSDKENTAVKDSDSLSIIPSIAGGSVVLSIRRFHDRCNRGRCFARGFSPRKAPPL